MLAKVVANGMREAAFSRSNKPRLIDTLKRDQPRHNGLWSIVHGTAPMMNGFLLLPSTLAARR